MTLFWDLWILALIKFINYAHTQASRQIYRDYRNVLCDFIKKMPRCVITQVYLMSMRSSKWHEIHRKVITTETISADQDGAIQSKVPEPVLMEPVVRLFYQYPFTNFNVLILREYAQSIYTTISTESSKGQTWYQYNAAIFNFINLFPN